MRQGAAALAIISFTLTGCLGPSWQDPIIPLPPIPLPADVRNVRFTSILIDEIPPIPTDAAAGYTGNIGICVKLENPNHYSVYLRGEFEFYQVTLPDDAKRVVEKDSGGAEIFFPGTSLVGSGPTHGVRANETAEGGGSVQYAIHLWTEIVTYKTTPANRYGAPDKDAVSLSPPLRNDRWFNVTFTPFSGGTLAHEGGTCP